MFLRVLRSPRGNKSLYRSHLCLRLNRACSVFIFVSSTISVPIRARWRANGFPESICHGFFFHRSGGWSRNVYVTRAHFLSSFYAFALPWRSYEREKWPSKRHSRVRGEPVEQFSDTSICWDPPRHYLCLMTRNYVCVYCRDGKGKKRNFNLTKSNLRIRIRISSSNLQTRIRFSCSADR